VVRGEGGGGPRGRHAAVMIAGRIMFYVGVATAVTEMPSRPLARSLAR